jgi:transcriptional regulator with XRE-family HTH domain
MGEHPDQALATVLKRLREDHEMTQEDLAFTAGITVSALSRIERGLNSPGWMTVKRITSALEVSWMDLARELETTPPGADALTPRPARGS